MGAVSLYMYDAIAIANYFIEKSLATGKRLTPMQLVKLVYIAHGWYLARTGKPLLADAVQAWQFGPVIPTLYHEFKQFRDGQITRKGPCPKSRTRTSRNSWIAFGMHIKILAGYS
jgi:uncharacterized phage-associated protein